ncbi:MAG: hypothetical protein NTY66_04370 [Candidatus Vogelbacteria bacterium]|nr:hypothetical protein [Candidatus Vogelbacteria bacterium]
MDEKGDLAPHTSLAVTKHAVWQTDHNGFRTENGNVVPEIVIIGDSTVVGNSLSQEETLARVLSDRTGLKAYPYAPRSVNDYLNDDRFFSLRPKFVVISYIERSLTGLKPVKTEPTKGSAGEVFLAKTVKRLPWLITLASYVDRSFDPNYPKYVYRLIMGQIPNPLYTYASGTMLFFQGPSANAQISDQELERTAQTIKSYDKQFARMGAQLIFMPVPNKESVFYKLLPSAPKPDFLDRLTKRTRELGIDTIDLETPFRAKNENEGIAVYHTDDTHWNPAGVRIAVELLNSQMNQPVDK